MHPPFYRAAVLALVLGTACAPHRTGASASGRNRDEISLAELREHHFTDAYAAVEALHSNWLQTRGTDSFASPGQVLVYMDDSRIGGVESLRNIATNTISFIRHYDGLAATARWGLDHGNGVIYVSSRPK
ncbi:MAG: hypothetical protein JO180_06385 [Gemmatirosa sp.]|nr:hypothetical protein [Gemmatirosa sp.]